MIVQMHMGNTADVTQKIYTYILKHGPECLISLAGGAVTSTPEGKTEGGLHLAQACHGAACCRSQAQSQGNHAHSASSRLCMPMPGLCCGHAQRPRSACIVHSEELLSRGGQAAVLIRFLHSKQSTWHKAHYLSLMEQCSGIHVTGLHTYTSMMCRRILRKPGLQLRARL